MQKIKNQKFKKNKNSDSSRRIVPDGIVFNQECKTINHDVKL